MKPLKTLLSTALLVFLLSNWSCKDDIVDGIWPEVDPYDESIAWSGYYNFNKSNPFSGAFNDVSFNFNKEVDGQTYGVVIENTNLNQLSLQLLSIKLKNDTIGVYDLQDAAIGSIQHYKDFNKKGEFTSINNGTLTISASANKDEISGNYTGWGLSDNDTMYLSGNFNRKKK